MRQRTSMIGLLTAASCATLLVRSHAQAATAVPVQAAAPADSGVPLITLDDARALARRANLSLQVAREQVARAEITSKKAWGAVLPTIAVSASRVRNNQAIIVDFNLPEPILAQFGLPIFPPATIQRLYQSDAFAAFNWPLLNARSIPAVKNARAIAELSRVGFREAESRLLYTTSLAYYSVLSAERQVDVRRRALGNSQAHLDLERTRRAVGAATELSVLRAEVDVATQEQALVQAQNTARIAKHTLAVLLGRIHRDGRFADFRVVRPPPPSEPAPERMLTLAYASRLDLQAGRLQLTVAERFKTDTWAKLFPIVAGIGSYRWSDVQGFAGRNTAWQVGVALRWTLFAAGQRLWELQERQHDINAATLAVDDVRQQIAEQVSRARLDYESATAVFESARRRSELAARGAQLTEAQYQVGAATQLDVLDASRTLADAETTEAITELQLDVARLSLEQVLLTPTSGAGGVAAMAGAAATDQAAAAPVTSTPDLAASAAGEATTPSGEDAAASELAPAAPGTSLPGSSAGGR